MNPSQRRWLLVSTLAFSILGVFLAGALHAQFTPRPPGMIGPGVGPGVGPGAGPGIGPGVGPGFGPGAGPKFGPINPNPPGMNPPIGNQGFGGGKFPTIEKRWVCSGCGASLGNGAFPAGNCGGCGAKIVNGVDNGGIGGGAPVNPGGVIPGNPNPASGPGAVLPGGPAPGAVNPPVGIQPQIANPVAVDPPFEMPDNDFPAPPGFPQDQVFNFPPVNVGPAAQNDSNAIDNAAVIIAAAVIGALTLMSAVVIVALKVSGKI